MSATKAPHGEDGEPRSDAAEAPEGAEGPVRTPDGDATAATTTSSVTVSAAASGVTAVTAALRPIGRVLTSRRAPRLRRWLAAILVVLAVVGLTTSALAQWSHSMIFDTETWVATVAPVAEDPAVRHAVGSFVADKTIALTDLERRIENALPSDAKIVAAPLVDSLRSYLVREIDGLLATPTAQKIWLDVNRFVHQQLITALQDQNRYVSVNRDDVRLDLLPLIAIALQRLSAEIPRLLGTDITLPQIDPGTAPAQIRSLIESATGKTLSPDFGTVTLLKGSQGYEAKRLLSLFNTLLVVIWVVTALLIAAALVVSPRKRWTLLELGLGVLLAVVVVRVAERQLELRLVAAVRNEGAVSVARAFVESAVSSLNGVVVWLIVGGAIVSVAAFLTTRPQWLDAIGRGAGKLFGMASDLTAPQTAAARWVAAHLDVLRVLGVAAAVVVLLFAAGSLTAVLVTVLVLAVYELALMVFATGLPRETPGSGGTAAGQH